MSIHKAKKKFNNKSNFSINIRELLLIIIIFIVYFLSAKFGLQLGATSGFATLVWAPSGIALAATLLLGNKVLPAIAWAAFVTNFQNDATLLTAIGIAVGNTLEAYVGAYLIKKCTNVYDGLDRQKDVLCFFIAIALSAAVGATIGTLNVAASSTHTWEGFLQTWFAWWVGDGMGSLIVAPFIMIWVVHPRLNITLKGTIEALVLAISMLVICYLIFGTHISDSLHTFKFMYTLFPFVIWSSLRFCQMGSLTSIFVMSVIALWGTIKGLGPFQQGDIKSNIYTLYSYLFIISLTGLFLSAAILEKRKAVHDLEDIEDKLLKSHVDLERQVKNRTSELINANEQLEIRVEQRTKELLSAQERKAVIFEASLDCIITIDHDGNILEFNPAAEKTFGYNREKVIGKEMAEIIIPKRYRDAHRNGMSHYLSTGKGPVLGKRIEISAMRADGSEFPVELSIIALKLNGESFFTGFLRDITESKKVAEDLEDAKNNAEVANQTKTAFLANMSHEIRTPLGAILGFSELIIDSTISPSDKLNFMTSIKRNGELLSNIINDILDISKVEAGKLQIELRDTSIDEVLLELASILKLRADEKGIQLNISFDPSLPKIIKTDSLRLRQILINIVGNAIKFTEKGSVNVNLKLITTNEKIQLAFIVKDTGPGISEDEASKLFKSFSQADVSTKRKFGGTGLGLALSKKLAKLLGGDLILTESQINKGSTFTITIDPGAIDQNSLVGKITTQKVSPNVTAVRLDNIRILLVEDSPDNQLLVSRLLKNAGAQVEISDNGKIALEKIEKNEYDVVLMDLQMPVMDGYQATLELRKKGFKKPIIALTAHALKEERIYCLANGFTEHLTKPIKSQLLVDTILLLHNNYSLKS